MKFVEKENLEPKIKPMIQNLQDDLYQWVCEAEISLDEIIKFK